MATKTTVLSPNCSVISFSQGSTLVEVMSAINDEIVKVDGEGNSVHGWTLHDSTAGTNAKCYRALNKDGQTYKYLVLDFGTTANKVRLIAYESWNETTHTGTNAANFNNVAYDADLLLTDRGNVYLYINPRWLALCIKQFSSTVIYSTVQSAIGGIFEIARDNPDDTVAAGYPPFCLLVTGAAADSTNTAHQTLLLPKSISGNGNQPGELSTIFGKTIYNTNYRLIQFIPNVANAFSTKDWAITPYVHGPNNEIKGRIFGLKLYTRNKLYFMDKVSVTTDQDYMYDPTATPATDHYVIPGGYQSNGAYDVRFLIPV